MDGYRYSPEGKSPERFGDEPEVLSRKENLRPLRNLFEEPGLDFHPPGVPYRTIAEAIAEIENEVGYTDEEWSKIAAKWLDLTYSDRVRAIKAFENALVKAGKTKEEAWIFILPFYDEVNSPD